MNNVVYYIGIPGSGHVKIGTTKSLHSRLRSLATAHHDGDKLTVLATEPGSYQTEMRRHEQFAAHRGHGEWFRLTPDLQAHIDGLAVQSTPGFEEGYAVGYKAALIDRNVAALIRCGECGETAIPAWDDSEDDEPIDICSSCSAEIREEQAALEAIYTFMDGYGIPPTPDGFATLPIFIQRTVVRALRRHPGHGDYWLKMIKDVAE